MTARTSGGEPRGGGGKGWGDHLTVEVSEGIVWITLNRTDNHNAISPGIVYEIVAVLNARTMQCRYWSSPAQATPFRRART